MCGIKFQWTIAGGEGGGGGAGVPGDYCTVGGCIKNTADSGKQKVKDKLIVKVEMFKCVRVRRRSQVERALKFTASV